MVLAHISVDDIRRASVFCFFSCVLQCFLHSWACKISVIFLQLLFFNFSGFSTLLRAIFSIAKDAEHLSSRLDSLIQDFGGLLKQAGARVLPSPLPGSAMLEQDRVISVAFLRSKRLGNSLLQQTHGQRRYNVSGALYKLLDEDVTTFEERLTSCWMKMLQRIRNVLQVAGRTCYNVSGMACKLVNEDVTTYQERLASCWTKMLQRIRNVLQVAGRRCYNVSGTACKLLDEDVTMYQERYTSCWTKMLQLFRNVLQVAGLRCYNVSEIVIDNAGHRTLLHPVPKTHPKHTQPPPKKNNIQKWHQSCPSTSAVTKNMPWGSMRSKEQTVNEPISFSWWSLRVENLSCKPLLLT